MPTIRATFRPYPGHSRTVFLTADDLEFVSPRGITLEIEEISYEIDSLPSVKATKSKIADLEKKLVYIQSEQRLNSSFFEISDELSKARVELQQLISAESEHFERQSMERGVIVKGDEITSLRNELTDLQLKIMTEALNLTPGKKHLSYKARRQIGRTNDLKKQVEKAERELEHSRLIEKAERHLKVKQLEHSRLMIELREGLEKGISLERDAQVRNSDFIPKKDWIEKSQKVWGLLDNDLVKSRLKCEKSSIHIHGVFGKGYGAILRDSQSVPIVCSSRCLSCKDGISTFYTKLHGVALGVEIVLRYKLTSCKFYVPSFNLYNLLTRIWDPNGSENCDLLRDDLKSVLRPEDKPDFEKIYRLTRKILSCLHKLRAHGICFVRWQPKLSIYNKAAEFLANRGFDQDMNFQQMCDDDKLCEILYQDAVL